MSVWKGAVFELHAVLSGTEELHFEAWKRTFDNVLGELDHGVRREFAYEQDYLPHLYGRPRYAGVADFFRSRDIHLTHGHPTDAPGKRTVCGIANRKNELFRVLLAERGVHLSENVVSLISALRAHGIRTAVVSASRNCRDVLAQAELLEMLDTVIDGNDVLELSLPVAPEPDGFVLAADNLEVLPSECMLVEATPEGIAAGTRGNFGLVVGVTAYADEESLREHGADLLVPSAGVLSYERIRQWFETERREDGWYLTYHQFRPEQEMLREALTAVGNGYIGSRGAYCGAGMFADIHYPGTYVAGLWNTLGTEMQGRTVYNSDFVNIPNWLLIELKIGEGGFCRILGSCTIEEYEHSLDMRNAVMRRRLRILDRQGHRTEIETRRFISMAEPHLAAIEYRLTPLNYSKPVVLKSSLDGTIMNYGVPRYRGLNKRHLDGVHTGEHQGRIELHTRTNRSKIDIYMGARHTLTVDNRRVERSTEIERGRAYITELSHFRAEQDRTYTFRKVVSIFTSRDRDRDQDRDDGRDHDQDGGGLQERERGRMRGSLSDNARAVVDRYGREPQQFVRALREHSERWHALWERADIRIEPDRFAQRVVRLHAYHLLVGASPNSSAQDVGFTARGLHGEAYRGHVFWDELFIEPFYNLRFPEVTRGHLLYRYRRLEAARQAAREHGCAGAMYPWQSGEDGGEETQEVHYNPRSGGWDPDLSRNQRHISLAIAYDIWTYYYATHDTEFMQRYGLEMLLEICRFWADKAEYDESDGRYHIEGVMGPDEFHEKYPDADPQAEQAGLRDNAYTNVLTAWIMHKTEETWNHQPPEVRKAVAAKIDFEEQRELGHWREIASRLAVVIDEDGIISQFEGFRDLLELDWESYRRRYHNIRRLDRILKAEGDSPDRYQVCKQADTLMLFYVLSPGQVRRMLEAMGYSVEDEKALVTKNYEYYLQRTSHGSTLSYIVHSAITRYVEGHRNDTWHWFLEGLRSDIYDTQGGTTREAIHCGVMAGSIGIIIENFAGINLFRDRIVMNPDLPRQWNSLAFSLCHRSNIFYFEVLPELIRVRREVLESEADPDSEAETLMLQVGEHLYTPGADPLEIPYRQQSARMPI